jgi:hypothetical protein
MEVSLKILFINSGVDDYLTDGLFHGLRSILGNSIVDYPRMDYMYKDFPSNKKAVLANGGKTLYGLLDDSDILTEERKDPFSHINNYDVILVAKPSLTSYQLNYVYYDLKFWARKNKMIVIVDGDDSDRLFQFTNLRDKLFKNTLSLLKLYPNCLYFKREFYGYNNLFGFHSPKYFESFFKKKIQIFPISMSIPKVHIEESAFVYKSKDFTEYIVDQELALKFNKVHGALGKKNYVFNNEEDYYHDIRNSRYGVTVKRAGWDSLRHYEYASKGTVLCFKNLNMKPSSCAPFGLSNSNCIIYDDATTLLNKIENTSEEQYRKLSYETIRWVRDYTTEQVAGRFITQLLNY